MKRNKKKTSICLVIALFLSLFYEMPVTSIAVVKADYEINNPRIDENGLSIWDCLYFGRYWQEDTNSDGIANESDDKEPIKWRVLSLENNTALLLADKNLDFKSYHSNYTDNVKWENSALCSWLNSVFINEAFNDEERNAINNMTEFGGQVYLLSQDEVCNPNYGFDKSATVTDHARRSQTTMYAKTHGKNSNEYDAWWTRTRVSHDGCYPQAVNVKGDGSVNSWGCTIHFDNECTVRPCLYLDLSKEDIWSYAGIVKQNGGGTNEDLSNDPEVSDYNTSTEGVCAANSIATLLGNSDYSSYVGSMRSIAMVIPGLKQTNMGNKKVCHNMVPQGVCATNDYVLISAYCKDEEHNSVIYVMDKNTKKYITTILLSVEDNAGLRDGNHVGGLAFGNNTVYIAGSGDKKVWKLPYEAVSYAVSSGKDTYTATISKNHYISTIKASFIYWDDSYKELFVGNFDEADASKNFMYSYDIDTGKASSSKIQLPKQTQGVSFGIGDDNKTYCICSKSWGRTNQSEMYAGELKKIKNTSSYGLANWHKIMAPNMSEDIQVLGGTLYNCFESAANNYNNGGKKEQPFDRIPYIGVRTLLSSIMKEGKATSIKKQQKIAEYSASISEDEIADNRGIILEGSCGENVNYCLYDDGELLLSGQGSMENYSEDMTPWSDYKDNITSIYIDRGVTSIGEYAFYNCPNLTEVTASEYMNYDVSFIIGYNAFGNCSMLKKVTLPNISIDIKLNAFDESASIQFNSDSSDIKEYTMNSDNTVLHQHNFEYVETVKATCMESGYDLYQCECGCEEVTNIVEATAEHSYKEVERSEATEADEGFIKYQCENCIDTYIETLEYVQPTDIPKVTETPLPTKTPSSAIPKTTIVKKPSKVSGLVVKNKKNKKIIVSWGWKTNVSGFQIQYAQNRKFTKKKKSKIVGKWASQKTITKLKKGKTYYVRVRAYKKSSGKKIYGKWSKIKKIKIRK